MKIETLKNKEGKTIEGLISLTPNVYEDSRGFFYESWNESSFTNILNKLNQSKVKFVQDNHSFSKRGVIRGLHYQKAPKVQGKLVRCLSGEIFDVIVDLRKSSKTYLNWSSITLTGLNKKQLWIPEGFAHGFLTLSTFAEISYKVTNYWSSSFEETIKWDDQDINIIWPKISCKKIISEKDRLGKSISDLSQNQFFQ